MKPHTVVITIFGPDDIITQDVNVKYELERGNGRDWNITECRLLDRLTIEPSDIIIDLVLGISFEEHLHWNNVHMECKVKYLVTSETVMGSKGMTLVKIK